MKIIHERLLFEAVFTVGQMYFSTEGNDLCTSYNAPSRGWLNAQALPYPEEQEQEKD